MPINVKNLPPDGYSERENSDAINQILQFGSMGTNVYGGDGNVKSFTVPAGHFEGTGPFRVNDADVKPGSFIALDPTNVAAVIAAVGVTTIGDGFFEVNDPPPELMFAGVQVAELGGTILGGLNDTVIPFNTVSFQENFGVDLVLERLTSQIVGQLQANFTISGLYAVGRNFTFSFVGFDSGDNEIARFPVSTSTSNQNDVVSLSGNVLMSGINVGDYFELHGDASGANVTFTYNLAMNIVTISPIRGVIVTEEVTFNYIVVQ